MHRIIKIFIVVGLLVMALILLSCSDNSTEPEPEDNIETWQYAFINNDVASMYADVISTENNELMAIGYHAYRYCVDRFDEMGNLLWSKDHDDAQIFTDLGGGCIKKGSDGSYYMLGSGSSPADLSVLRMSDAGGWLSETTIRADSVHYLFCASLHPTDAGGAVVTLASRLGPEEAYEIRIARVVPEDYIVYQSLPANNFLGYILISGMTPDGNLLLIGQTMNGDNTDIQTMAVDTEGNVIAQNNFGSSMNDMLLDIINVGNNEFLAVGWSSYSDFFIEERFIYLVKFDSNGDVIWEKRIGSGDLAGYNISPTKDGNYVIGGSMPNIASGMYAASLIKVDPSGNMIWKKPVSPGPFRSSCTGVTETSDGGLAISGYFDNNGPDAYYRYIAKTDNHGNCTDSVTIIEE